MKYIYKFKYVMVGLLVVVAGFFYSCSYFNKDISVDAYDTVGDGEESSTSKYESKKDEELNTKDIQTLDMIYVYVTGKVITPGVYELPIDSRIYVAIELAGGLANDADEKSINMAQKLKDGDHIHVYAIGESYTLDTSDDGNSLININTATKEQLMTLSGIGESRAESIITYRDTVGAFLSIEDIMNVSGIKEAAFEKIKDNISVE